MPYIDVYGETVETEEERKAREAREKAAGETPVAKRETTVYEDGSQTHTTTQEVPAPSLFDRAAGAVSQAGTNFSNNLQQMMHPPNHHFTQLPPGWVHLPILPHIPLRLLLHRPVVVHPVHLIRSPLHHISMSISSAVNLLTRKLRHNNGLVI